MLLGGRPEREEFAAPAHLPILAVQFWDEIVPQLVDVGLLDRADRSEIEMIATAYAMFRMCLLTIQTVGPWITKKDGGLAANPAAKEMREWMATYNRLAEMYGMNPVARTRLGLAELAAKTAVLDLEEKLDGRPAPEVVVEADVVDEGESDGLPGG